MTIKNTANTGRGQTHPKESLGIINSNDFASLVPVISGQIGGRESNIVSAKALHKSLGVGRVFSSWFNARVEEYDFKSAVDYVESDTPISVFQSSNIDQVMSARVQTSRGGDRRSKDYAITLNMAKELAMVERNDQGRAIRRYFIQCEEELYRSVPEVAARLRHQLKMRIGAANMFKAMCTALEAVRAEHGKQTSQNHYTNESNMIARIVLGGITAKQWVLANGLDGDPRDNMSVEQLEHLSYLESTNITLIDMGMDYEPRKAELMRLSQRWLTKRLGSENDDK
ncbi:Phage anti-repressor protein [Serratia quinivorans]|uniref:antA/AntB antirepressor family protein n=1 Tax=Serratia quinivorans TaxID=137545 RepID=UPI00217B0DAB|nr:antA/AntB antirepressor family protein [Serratia quinivorans]CAI0972350.1 Phage anti-repressor protein [Serratia quinivorans]CAI0988117.1 Phage anti-repressor protein [Serratia quinivorans]CAI1778573.1 Phage anti-repressor protein [Serratia quinivorans]CAI2106031.1 Phage anti-repressor protein [Serratia quinivorans]CAI2462787.1 Phage anti-repressor protein [Serratia quinivorans]